jgi:glutamate synthase (NADPH/NADH) large chain
MELRGWEVLPPRRYGVAMVFLPTDPKARAACERALEDAVAAEGQRVIGWRDVPVEPEHLGPLSRGVMPCIRQLLVARRRLVPSAFERKLFVIRKLAEGQVHREGLDPEGQFHVASFSSETLIYKGLLLPEQLPLFYADLRSPEMVSALALVHSRCATWRTTARSTRSRATETG